MLAGLSKYSMDGMAQHAGHLVHAGHGGGGSGEVGSGHGDHGDHNMATAFEWNARVKLLAPGLESQTVMQYAAVLLVLFVAGAAREFFAARRRRRLLSGAGDRSVARVRKEAALQYMGLYAYDMCLMLLIMSFNVGVFAAIVGGVGTGHYFFWDPAPLSAGTRAEEDAEKLPCC